MSDYAHREKKNRIIGISISVGLHILVLLLFLWVSAWEEPYPPKPEYGIELNFGIDNTGSGQEPVQSQEKQETEEETAEEVVEETSEEEIQQFDDTEAEEVTQEPVKEDVEEAIEPAVTDQDSPLQAEEVPKEDDKETPQKEKKEELKPTANPNALFPGDNASQGETASDSGDQGNPEGDVDAEAMMGPQGGGSGSQLDMSGWKWDSPPKVSDQSEQRGKIKFEISVDSNGEVIGVRVMETTVSAEVVKIYQDEVSKLTFYRTSGGKTAQKSTGTITFLIRAK